MQTARNDKLRMRVDLGLTIRL